VSGIGIRVLVVDDHELISWGLRTVLARQPWIEGCLQATDGARAMTLARRYGPQVALVELFLDDTPTTELCRHLHRSATDVQVLLMSSARSIPLRSLGAAGARGYVSTRWSVEEIVGAVRLAGAGLTMTTRGPGGRDAGLTPREEDVLVVMAQGATNAEIARELYLSVYTVKQHAHAAYRKLHARNRTEAVQRAQRLGLLA
jgi:two-component system response regulator DesR